MDVRVKLDLELCLFGGQTVLLKGDLLMLVLELMELGVFLSELDLELAIFFFHVADVVKISNDGFYGEIFNRCQATGFTTSDSYLMTCFDQRPCDP